MNGLTIGQLAQSAAVHIETLRYYERRGLLAKPPRSVSNYRLYPPDSARRVCFIKHAQELGFSLKEIKELLSLRAAPKSRCADVRARASAKIADIEAKIRSLQAMRTALLKLVAECSGQGPATSCPILEALDSEKRVKHGGVS
jgi:MerR family transcriptional regulator, copper efflux regulator